MKSKLYLFHDHTFNTSVNELGLFQNSSKKEVICTLAGTGATSIYRALKTKVARGSSSVRFLDQMKYLAAWLAANGSNTPEVNSRLDGAWAKWASFKHIWYDNEQPIKVKRILFTSLVYNTAISALEAFVLSDAENDRIICFVVKRARALLCGRAYKVHGDKTDKMTNSQVLKSKSCQCIKNSEFVDSNGPKVLPGTLTRLVACLLLGLVSSPGTKQIRSQTPILYNLVKILET